MRYPIDIIVLPVKDYPPLKIDAGWYDDELLLIAFAHIAILALLEIFIRTLVED